MHIAKELKQADKDVVRRRQNKRVAGNFIHELVDDQLYNLNSSPMALCIPFTSCGLTDNLKQKNHQWTKRQEIDQAVDVLNECLNGSHQLKIDFVVELYLRFNELEPARSTSNREYHEFNHYHNSTR